MSTTFYFKSIEITNLRVFKNLKVDKFRRINIFSGLNGGGKSALIETLFLTVDLNHPACLIRPFQWRGMPLTGGDLKLLFPNIDESGHVKVKTRNGDLHMRLKFGPPDRELILSATRDTHPDSRGVISQLSAPNTEGVSVDTSFPESQKLSKQFFSQNGDTLTFTGTNQNEVNVAQATYLSQFTPSAPQVIADRVSKIIRNRRKIEFITYLKALNPDIEDASILQDGPTAQVYITKRDQSLTPLSLMGGGLRALAEIVSCAMVASDGVLLIDEMDSALHYSVVAKLWSIVSKIANNENLQIFAITHSKETIESAARGIADAGRSADFQYFRVDEFEDHHECTPYDAEDIQDAFEMHVEIR